MNGELRATLRWLDPGPPGIGATWSTWKIGIASPGDTTHRYSARGLIDEMRLYKRALSAAEIKALAALK